ncbi:MAG: hypothetical protein HPY45_04070 [Anaerolineae bacterium]|nr:hypothetical protein [Anaerolineae bacterium]
MACVKTWKLDKAGNLALLPQPSTRTIRNLDEASKILPDGAYTSFRTFYGNRVLHLEDHIKRLEESSRLANKPVELNDAVIRKALKQVIDHQPGEKRIRLTVDLEEQPGQLYITSEIWSPLPPESYQHGVKTITKRLHRTNPKAKLTHFINNGKVLSLPTDVNEILMVDEDDVILEGMSSNFFAVCEGKIWTEEQRVLSGITRLLVLEIIKSRKVPVVLEGIKLQNIPCAQEAFITSSSRGVLPVRQIDDVIVGNGKPGDVTRAIIQDYDEQIRRLAEPL